MALILLNQVRILSKAVKAWVKPHRKKERKKEIFKFFILQIKTHSTLIKSLYWDVIINNI